MAVVNPVHDLNALLFILVTLRGTKSIFVKEVQFWNIVSDIVVIPIPIEMLSLFSFVQPLNALFPMLVTESGMVMDVRERQPSNALSTIIVTEFPRFTEVREPQRPNAAFPMLVAEFSMVTEIIRPQA